MTEIKWQDTKTGQWHDFDQRDLLDCSPAEYPPFRVASVPVVIKSGDEYIVNNGRLFQDYKKAGKQVKMIAA